MIILPLQHSGSTSGPTGISRVQLISKTTNFGSEGLGTINRALFTLNSGSVIVSIWGVVTSALGTNHTDGHLNYWDASAQTDLSLGTGLTLNAAPIGSLLLRRKNDLILKYVSGTVGGIIDPSADNLALFVPFCVVRKSGGSGLLRYTYTTTDNPHQGEIIWYALWQPISDGATLVPFS